MSEPSSGRRSESGEDPMTAGASDSPSPLGFTVHVLLGVTRDGVTDEATREFPTWAEAVEAVSMIPDQLMSQGVGFHAITIVHTEDFPLLMQGAATRRPDGD